MTYNRKAVWGCKWKRLRASPDSEHGLIAVIPDGQGQARRHVVPAGAAKEMARHIVRGHAARGAKVRAYVYDHRAEQLASF